jgi:hypothetical protein
MLDSSAPEMSRHITDWLAGCVFEGLPSDSEI